MLTAYEVGQPQGSLSCLDDVLDALELNYVRQRAEFKFPVMAVVFR